MEIFNPRGRLLTLDIVGKGTQHSGGPIGDLLLSVDVDFDAAELSATLHYITAEGNGVPVEASATAMVYSVGEWRVLGDPKIGPGLRKTEFHSHLVLIRQTWVFVGEGILPSHVIYPELPGSAAWIPQKYSLRKMSKQEISEAPEFVARMAESATLYCIDERCFELIVSQAVAQLRRARVPFRFGTNVVHQIDRRNRNKINGLLEGLLDYLDSQRRGGGSAHPPSPQSPTGGETVIDPRMP